ncbi:hypothetical protein J2W23_000543 [Variovorax boronicumulans]|uniref:hypothetical protein n=1 Tax=Variovorax boronicumulans TaxID=436515 RepID=UPI00278851DE|nr:hypothetical protein [Variovorax boronicumulans]MDQ0012179.1 hypothetical protein [Variovorax boronicumulans]
MNQKIKITQAVGLALTFLGALAAFLFWAANGRAQERARHSGALCSLCCIDNTGQEKARTGRAQVNQEEAIQASFTAP